MATSGGFKENDNALKLELGNLTNSDYCATGITEDRILKNNLTVNGTAFPFSANMLNVGNHFFSFNIGTSYINYNREGSTGVEGGLLSSGTITASIPTISIYQTVANSDGYIVEFVATARTLSGTYTFEEFFDDDDCDDDCE